MKTLIITLEYPPQIGGIATYIFNLAAHMPPADVVVYAPEAENGIEFDAPNAWLVYRKKPYFNLIWPRWLRMLWQIKKIIKKEKIQQIYLHHALPVGYVGYILKRLYKIPYTVFFHGTDLEVGSHFKRGKLERVCRHADKIVVNSLFLKNKLTTNIQGINENKIRTIYPCADDAFLEKVSPSHVSKLRSLLALEGKKVVLTVSRMDEGKGFPHLVRLLPKVLVKVPNALCLFVGDGPKREMLEEMVVKSGLQNSVRFVGNIRHDRLPVFYQSADLFALLAHRDTNTEEGWGTVFMEAAASGLPVVAGRVGGIEESVLDGITGKVVDAYQEEDVLSAIITLLNDSEKSQKMGALAEERTKNEFNWSNQIRKL
ncbi:glycosyltransferase family 4 protein [Patescibacteria group bacterium]|nr:glycosyltransferase family 4 protein [Patescibacteria group bacterium]MBU1613003.1 glycosyltransferase family 4 protein [Patescibacteria group bacterium]